eukprot:GHVL01042503.1.p1 GENE.GHVL01042503.1~~GHVL01042503.1.p1  ORF type:complete len:112 (-),score=16.11 GHVL01042503.1:238-573(-)
MGVLGDQSPSAIFATGWPMNPSMRGCPTVRLLITHQSAEELDILLKTSPPPDFRKNLAKKVALNLFQYIDSFRHMGPPTALIQYPQNVLDQWFIRFEEKYNKDPSFLFQTE